jgi:hypothetical protein
MRQSNMNDWNIQSRARQCQACGKSFADKQPYHTLLLDEKRDYLRLDVCETCWRNQYSQGAKERKGFVSYWQGVFELPPAAPVEAIQKQTAETLLREIVLRNDPQFAPAAFILAVMLERKRLLRVKEQLQSEGRRIFVYEQPKTGDLFTIPDPQLQLNQLEQVQRTVASLLEGGLPALAPPAASCPATPAAPAAAPSPPGADPAQTAPGPAMDQTPQS